MVTYSIQSFGLGFWVQDGPSENVVEGVLSFGEIVHIFMKIFRELNSGF